MTCRVEYMVKNERVVGLKIVFESGSTIPVDFESIGLVGQFDPKTKKIEPIYVLISTENRVRAWLNKFGGADVIEYVRWDKHAELLREIKEKDKIIEELREKLANKIDEVKKLYNRIKELNERIDELELELAGREKPVV